MKLADKRIDYIFYISFSLSFILFVLPIKYTWVGFGPTIIGWIWIALLIPISLISFLWKTVFDIKNKRLKEMTKRTLFFAIIIYISISYWFYLAKSLGNI